MHVCEMYTALTLGAHIRSPGAGIKDGYEPPEVGVGKKTWGPGQEQCKLLTANPSPQILYFYFK